MFLKRLRTIPWFIRMLVGLFLVAQFAGVVSSPRASALPVAAALASHDHVQHTQDYADQNRADHGQPPHHHDHSSLADTCCGLHACFSGVLPPLAVVATECAMGERMAAFADSLTLGLSGGRLDRPPRPLH